MGPIRVYEALFVSLLTIAGAAMAAPGAGTPVKQSTETLMKEAFRVEDGDELARICLELAERKTPAARTALASIIRDTDRVALLEEGRLKTDPEVPSLYHPMYRTEQVLAAFVSSWPDSAEDLLLVQLEKDWDPVLTKPSARGPLRRSHTRLHALQRSYSRLHALGLLPDPSDRVCAALERVVSRRESPFRWAARWALVRLGDDKAKAILSRVVEEEPELWTEGRGLPLLASQYARTKPPMFELLVEGHRVLDGLSRREDRVGRTILRAILNPRWSAGGVVDDEGILPSYDDIDDPAAARRIARAVEGLLENPGKRPLTAKERKGLLALKAKLTSLAEELERKAGTKRENAPE